MLKRVPIEKLDDYFTDVGNRKQQGVYCYRITGYNQQIHEFILRYHEAARLGGVIVEGKLYNPDQKMLAYYNEIMGMEFRMERSFICEKLHKWLPRMNTAQCDNVASAIFEVLTDLKKSGKNENMLKNVYVKFMCWLYYRLERIVHLLGNAKIPKVLYEGEPSNYELLLFNVLCLAGCDVVLLQYHGDEAYLKADPASALSERLMIPGMGQFPETFSLKQIRQEIQDRVSLERLYGEKPKRLPCTNAWISGKIFEDVRKAYGQRGTDDRFFYNCFCLMNGVEDKLTYPNELYHLKVDLTSANRKVVIVDHTIPQPTPEEISQINRKNYQKTDQLILDLSSGFKKIPDRELQRLLHIAFVDTMIEESQNTAATISRLTNKAVYLLCWLNRYRERLFGGWKYPEIAAFLFMGGCQNEYEALFCRFLSKLPVDVIIFAPDLNRKCCLTAQNLYEVNYSDTLAIEYYPEEQQGIRAGTAAFHAERELDTMMYQDSGIYRNQQYDKANVITLQTMYEEIAILWNQEMKYRPNFSVTNDTVNMPVLFSKIVGLKDQDILSYWQGIKELITPDTLVFTNVPVIQTGTPNPMKQYAAEFFKNGKLQKRKIKEHKAYPYGILRESRQDYILDKIQLLIERKLIKGTFENGMEYGIIATLLNLDQKTVRLLQKFDFTKTNPKVIYVITQEAMMSAEDVIYLSFLNLAGFDVLLFVPTGYQCFEKHLNRNMLEEHQIGEYHYDLRVPNFNALPSPKRHKWRDKFFKRGK